MIPVTLRPEPHGFDQAVRRRGHGWLREQGIALNAPPPNAAALPTYWAAYNKRLWQAYSGVCAYLAIWIPWDSGAANTDHFFAKSSSKAGDAYEWSNYRLACWGANRNKNRFDDVLDPVGLAPHTFVLNLASGEISPNPALSPSQKSKAKKTIKRLKLDSHTNNAMRAEHFQDYINKEVTKNYLKRRYPFVHQEIVRQGL